MCWWATLPKTRSRVSPSGEMGRGVQADASTVTSACGPCMYYSHRLSWLARWNNAAVAGMMVCMRS